MASIAKRMTFEFAIQLKDAGFPFKEQPHEYIHAALERGIVINGFSWDGLNFYTPSLSELIEACGDDFDSIDRFQKDRWAAYTHPDKFHVQDANTGSTPEEAVAKLWLALHQN